MYLFTYSSSFCHQPVVIEGSMQYILVVSSLTLEKIMRWFAVVTICHYLSLTHSMRSQVVVGLTHEHNEYYSLLVTKRMSIFSSTHLAAIEQQQYTFVLVYYILFFQFKHSIRYFFYFNATPPVSTPAAACGDRRVIALYYQLTYIKLVTHFSATLFLFLKNHLNHDFLSFSKCIL